MLGRHKTTTLLELNDGLIHTLRWKETLIAFANDKVFIFRKKKGLFRKNI